MISPSRFPVWFSDAWPIVMISWFSFHKRLFWSRISGNPIDITGCIHIADFISACHQAIVAIQKESVSPWLPYRRCSLQLTPPYPHLGHRIPLCISLLPHSRSKPDRSEKADQHFPAMTHTAEPLPRSHPGQLIPAVCVLCLRVFISSPSSFSHILCCPGILSSHL